MNTTVKTFFQIFPSIGYQSIYHFNEVTQTFKTLFKSYVGINKNFKFQMQKFQDLLTEAAQLKQEQLKQERKNFEALPEYLKSGLNYAKKYVQLRKQHYLVQKCISQKLKVQGNDHYLLQNYGEALSKYQQALSVFRFIHATKYENLKDEDIIYENYKPEPEYKEEHQAHLVALYLNISSALTKMNKRDEAVHASEQALKINENNPKIYYKKAQAYLQYINRESKDIKVGFYYLNKAYELSKDQNILVQMHKIKKQIDEEKQKEKKWFKFMFDKNKDAKTKDVKSQEQIEANQTKQNTKPIENNPESKEIKPVNKIQHQETNKNNKQKKSSISSQVQGFYDQVKASQNNKSSQAQISEDVKVKDSRKVQIDAKQTRLKEQFDRFRQQNQNDQEGGISELQKLQKTKLTLKPYLIIPRDDRWMIKYQEDFIHKHGSKIYSILQLYNYSEYLIEFKSLLAKCLELKQAKATAERDDNKILEEKISMYQKFIDWIKKHPVQKYKKYIERFQLQTKWIQQNRGKPLDEVYPKEPEKKKKTITVDRSQQRLNQFLESVRQTHNKAQRTEETKPQKSYEKNNLKQQKSKPYEGEQMLQRQQEIKRNTNMKKQQPKPPKNQKINTYGFKEQWQCNNEDEAPKNIDSGDEVPQNLKGFLQNYEQFPMYQEKLRQMKKQKEQKEIPRSRNKQNAQKQNRPQNMQEELQNVKENPFGFVRTFLVILAITFLGKLIF